MEFFRIIQEKTHGKTIQKELTLDNLELMTNEIFVIGAANQMEAKTGGIWGEFTLTRTAIRGGLRFALVECPNALTWTITTGLHQESEIVLVHLTINRQQISQEFTEEINEFLDDQCSCLHNCFSENVNLNLN